MKRLIFFLWLSVQYSWASQLPNGFIEQLIAQNLDPTDMVIAPDGRIFITIKSGKIVIIESGVLVSSVLLNLPVDNFNERGLGHMVLDPNFNANNYYYIYYTVPGMNFNRVSRFTANGNSTLPGTEEVLMELDVLSSTIHNAGDMVFGNDGKLYITTGDGGNPASAQSMSSVLGKVLRINSDGSIPSDNPFFNTATGKNKAIWAIGFRNPFSLDVQVTTGRILLSDVGQETWEEINDVEAGKNYGWPGIEGPRTNQPLPQNYKDPLFAYQHGTGPDRGCAIVGAAFYHPTSVQFPNEYVGKFYFADYCNGYIKYIDLSSGVVKTFATGISRPLAIMTAPDGSLYYLARAGLGGGSQGDNTSTSNGTLWKVNYAGSGAPFISSQPQSTTAALGDVVSFTVGVSGVQPFFYEWMADGVVISGAISSSYSYTVSQLNDDGRNFTCKISNSLGTIISSGALLTVTSNTRPIPQLTVTLPNGATLYQAGQTLQFTGSALDSEDGPLPISALTWKIDFRHDQHTHPGLSPVSGLGSGFYTIPKIGETADNVWYRVILTATDGQGLTKSVYQDVFPQKIDISLTSMPSNLILLLDGQTVQTPYTFKSVVGITRSLEAPLTQQLSNTLQSYSSWTEASLARQFVFDTPTQNKNFTASYQAVPIGNGNGLIGEYRNTLSQTATVTNGFANQINLSRIDPTIDFNWAVGSPSPQINSDYFTIRWTGELLPQFSEIYRFYLSTDDGGRLWVDDILLVDKWIPQGLTEWSGPLIVQAGQRYRVKVEYFELAGNAAAKLQWSSARTPKQVIPQSQLFASPITGTEPIGPDNSITVYPQPVEKELFISLNSAKTKSREFAILDILGKIIMRGEWDTNYGIDVRDLAPGIYFLKTDSGNNKFVKK